MPSARARSYLKQVLMDLNEDIYSNTIITGDFDTAFYQRTDQQEKINKENKTKPKTKQIANYTVE